jgi:hypothetical protein
LEAARRQLAAVAVGGIAAVVPVVHGVVVVVIRTIVAFEQVGFAVVGATFVGATCVSNTPPILCISAVFCVALGVLVHRRFPVFVPVALLVFVLVALLVFVLVALLVFVLVALLVFVLVALAALCRLATDRSSVTVVGVAEIGLKTRNWAIRRRNWAHNRSRGEHNPA